MRLRSDTVSWDLVLFIYREKEVSLGLGILSSLENSAAERYPLNLPRSFFGPILSEAQ